ncbi:hypothetical protein, partial [Morganella morganii]|uniref:hypothetical protein n=1 Tax=Morganella morganii TaxID=582 RepID=UPI001FFD310F
KRKASQNTSNLFAAPELNSPFDMVLPNLSKPPKHSNAEYANTIIVKKGVIYKICGHPKEPFF